MNSWDMQFRASMGAQLDSAVAMLFKYRTVAFKDAILTENHTAAV